VVLLGEAMVMVWVAGLLLLGFLGFFVVLALVVVKFTRSVFGSVFGHGGWTASAERSGPAVRLCGNERCGYLNPAQARYCARCGRKLGALQGADEHG
jgi:hypothetical protein